MYNKVKQEGEEEDLLLEVLHGYIFLQIERNERLGRHLVATSDIPAGTLILNELPMIVGPRQLSKPVCLGCHKEIADAKSCRPCSRCHWPVCSTKCQDSPIHEPECRIIRYGGAKVFRGILIFVALVDMEI